MNSSEEKNFVERVSYKLKVVKMSFYLILFTLGHPYLTSNGVGNVNGEVP